MTKVLQIDAFTSLKGQGNPAGVVSNGDDFSTAQMQAIAKKVGFNETVFICSSNKADIQLRFFTPGHETPLCGHATIAAIFSFCHNGEDRKMTIETKAGLLPISYIKKSTTIEMRQANATFIHFESSKQLLCQSLGIHLEDLHPTLPIQYGNTGSWTLLVPVKHPKRLDQMIPNSKQFPHILKEMPRSSIHPFAIVSAARGIYTARHFSSPYSGTIEDSVTGTASGVMGVYTLTHLYKNETRKKILVHQGKHVTKVGEVLVISEKKQESIEVSIAGTACFNDFLTIDLGTN